MASTEWSLVVRKIYQRDPCVLFPLDRFAANVEYCGLEFLRRRLRSSSAQKCFDSFELFLQSLLPGMQLLDFLPKHLKLFGFRLALGQRVRLREQGDAKGKGEAKELSGISIVGNKEAPKSLFIVPWKSSELGVETGLASSLLNEDLKPVDKEVFERELEFYSITAVE